MKLKKSLAGLVAVLMLLVSVPALAQSQSCAAKAQAVAANNDGRVLSVRTVGRGAAAMCRITVLVKSREGKPPRKKTITVRK